LAGKWMCQEWLLPGRVTRVVKTVDDFFDLVKFDDCDESSCGG
jgi:hypothetical protein